MIFRLGIVLGMGGAVAKMLTPFRMFAGGPIGSGKQWFFVDSPGRSGQPDHQSPERPSNGGHLQRHCPQPGTHGRILAKPWGKVLKRPSWLPVPEFALEAMLGDGAKVVLEGATGPAHAHSGHRL